jgi:hypothetical protein
MVVGSHAPFDLVAVHRKTGAVELVDAKAVKLSIRAPRQRRATILTRSPSAQQRRLGVKFAFVLPDGSVSMQGPRRQRRSRRRR